MKSHPIVPLLLHGVLIMTFTVNLSAQTTLSGDHVIEGNLDVGTSATQGSIKITGQTGNTALPGIKVSGHGGVLFEGGLPNVGSIPAENSGTRFMWYPKKAALRAGTAIGTSWNDSNIGFYSVAFGHGTRALGVRSTAMGYETLASGSVSAAFGADTIASGPASTATGDITYALGYGATSMGEATIAAGDVSTSMGRETVAGAIASLAIGRNNIGDGHPTQWNEEDPLFEIGNGTWQQPRNALTVLKNGRTTMVNKFWAHEDPTAIPTATGASGGEALVVEGHSVFKGNVKMHRQGDISMGEFGNPGD